MGDYLKDILDRKIENVKFIKCNNRWWFECAPNSVEEFDFMMSEKELEIVDYKRKEGITRDLVYKEFNEPIIHVYKSETGEVITAKFTEKNMFYKQWMQVQRELALGEGVVEYADGKWNILTHSNVYMMYTESDAGDILRNRLNLIEKYINETGEIINDLDVGRHKNYYKQRLEVSRAEFSIIKKDIEGIQIEIEKMLKVIAEQENLK